VTIAELNMLDHSAFVNALGAVFEHSRWVPDRAWAGRPFADIEALHAAMTHQVEKASFTEKLRLLQAHPDLGAQVHLSPASATEQASAGLGSLTSSEYEQLQRLNSAYRSHFGFPFLLAVKGRTKYDVLRALQTRITALPEDEYREALQQVYRIARFRLEYLIQS